MPVVDYFSRRLLLLTTMLCMTVGLMPVSTFAQAGATVAQAGATVSGSVLDPDAAAIPGAIVTLTPTTGAALITKSGGAGEYTFTGVPAGTYSLTVTMAGFASFVRQGLRIGAAPVAVSVKLSIQSESTEINVTTQQNQVSVDPDSNGSSVVIKGKELEALSDDPDELSNELSALAGPAAGPNGGQIYVDGFTGGQLPPKSSIREIRVNQNPFSAQFDKQGFGRVEVFTKPGTDSFHGQFSAQGQDKSFNTSSPFLGASNQQPGYHRVFFIGSLTGPVTKTSSFSLAGSHRTIQDNSIFAGQILSTGPGSAVLCAPGTVGCTLNPYPDSARATFHPQTRYDLTPRFDIALGAKNTLTARYQFEHGSQQNAGLGSTSLSTTAFSTTQLEHQLQMSDTQILSQRIINETRFEFQRERQSQSPVSTAATVSLQGYFTGGGSGQGAQSTTHDHIELQNYTSIALKKNFIRAGMRLRDDREALFSNSGANGSFSYASAASYVANQPFQYRVVNIANPRVETHVLDVGFYAEDDWRVKPNLTLSYGMRYESQTTIHSNHDLAPRVSVSYGVPRKSGNPTTVLRGGFGIFYDRFNVGDVLQTLRQNGINQVTNIYRAPDLGCSPANIGACGSSASATNTTYVLGQGLRSAYNMQTALGVDQQFSKRLTVSLNYLNTTGLHQYFSRSLPVSVNVQQYQYQSGGVFRQNQLLLNIRAQLTPRFSVFGFYTINFANSNSNGASSFQTDSLNPRTDYGPALFNQRHRLFLFGNWQAPLGLNFSPFMIVNSGTPYNITAGTDVNGDTVINDRAAFANGVSGTCTNALTFVAPPLGTQNYTRVPQGYCTGPNQFTFNLRAVKVFGFGKRAARPDAAGGDTPRPDAAGGGGGQRGGGGGGGGRGGGIGGGINSGHKYTFNAGAQIQNLFNYVPYAAPNGQLTSYNADPAKSLFGKSLSLQGGPFAMGSAVRTITLQMNFNF